MTVMHIVELGPNLYEELFASRTELHADRPLEFGQISTSGRVVFWTEWLLYSHGRLLSARVGPRIEHSFDTLLPRTWEVPLPDGGTYPLPTTLIMGGIKTAFVTLVNEGSPLAMPPVVPESPTTEEQAPAAPMG